MKKNPNDNKDKKPAHIDKLHKKIDELEEKIKEITSEKEEIFSKLQRVSADYANFQKRTPKQIAESVTYEKEAIIKALLPGLDNFEHALAGAKNAEDCQSLIKGIELVYQNILNILKSMGVEQVTSLDQDFDPNIHQAMMRRSQPDSKDNTIIEEFQKGYSLNGKSIRPARVIVNKIETNDDQQNQEKEKEKDNQCDTE